MDDRRSERQTDRQTSSIHKPELLCNLAKKALKPILEHYFSGVTSSSPTSSLSWTKHWYTRGWSLMISKWNPSIFLLYILFISVNSRIVTSLLMNSVNRRDTLSGCFCFIRYRRHCINFHCMVSTFSGSLRGHLSVIIQGNAFIVLSCWLHMATAVYIPI